jgi:hypothetical protein
MPRGCGHGARVDLGPFRPGPYRKGTQALAALALVRHLLKSAARPDRRGRSRQRRVSGRNGNGLLGQEGKLTKGGDPHPGVDDGNERRLPAEEARWA